MDFYLSICICEKANATVWAGIWTRYSNLNFFYVSSKMKNLSDLNVRSTCSIWATLSLRIIEYLTHLFTETPSQQAIFIRLVLWGSFEKICSVIPKTILQLKCHFQLWLQVILCFKLMNSKSIYPYNRWVGGKKLN